MKMAGQRIGEVVDGDALVDRSATEREAQIQGIAQRRGIVARDRREARAPVQGERCVHVGQGVEPHLGIAEFDRSCDDSLDQRAADPAAAASRGHEQPLHLAVSNRRQRAQRDAAERLAVGPPRQQQGAAGRGISARQTGKFTGEILKAEVDAE